MCSIECRSADDTRAAGEALGSRLRPGSIVLLRGELGAGKTTLAQGIARGYGIHGQVTSPSFALIHVHEEGGRRLVHFDPYRLDAAAAMSETGWMEYLDGTALMLIEWPERLQGLIPEPFLTLDVTALDDGTRRITLSSQPPDFVGVFAGVWP
jgi:tRNA threonylcarbamoyladenosine biosynthesis protein TsaE